MSFRKNLIALSLFNVAQLLREQEEAAAAAPPAPEAPAAPAPEAAEGGVATDEQGKPITIDSVIDRMNIIRSGLSFEDPEVYGKLTTMFKKMTPEDKMKLNKQLTDIGAIVQNIPAEKQAGQQPEEAPAPEAAPEAAPPAAPAPAAPAPAAPPAPAA